MRQEVERIHATAIAVDGRAAIIRGSPGSGKSDLALRCLACAPAPPFLPHAAALVADDQVQLERRGDAVFASAPEALRGKIEIRGIGIYALPSYAVEAAVALIVDLVAAHCLERMPDPWPRTRLAGLEFPVMRLSAFETSAHVKVLAALIPGNLDCKGGA